MICHLRDILNVNTLHTIERIDQIVNVISIHNRLTIMNNMSIVHDESSLDYSLLYILNDCHISIKTFPESGCLTFLKKYKLNVRQPVSGKVFIEI